MKNKLSQKGKIYLLYLAAVGSNNHIVRDTPICLVAQFRLLRKGINKDPSFIIISNLNLFHKYRASLHQPRRAWSKHHSIIPIVPISETHTNCKNQKQNTCLRLKGHFENQFFKEDSQITCHIAKWLEELAIEPKSLAAADSENS